MDKLKTIIATFSPEDQKELCLFVQRQKKKKNRKDLDLLNILRKEQDFPPEVILQKLYPDSNNQVAYHALRKRLMRHLNEFILLKQMDEDPSTASSVMGMISMARYLFEKRVDKLGWDIIRKAESVALENEHFDLLNNIYNLQIEKSGHETADAWEDILLKRERNKLRAEEDEKAALANNHIKHKLAEIRMKGISPDFDHTIREVLEKYQLSEAVNNHPRLFFNLMSITRSMVIARQDYYNFEPLVMAGFLEMEARHLFSGPHHVCKLELLYMIAHVLYRNKKFDESLKWLEKMAYALEEHHKSHYYLFYPRYAMLKAVNFTFTYRVKEAIPLLEDMLQNPELRLQTQDILNARLNMGYYSFLAGDKTGAVRAGIEMQHSDKWLEKKMGKEWVLKKNLSEMILQYELGNYDFSRGKIRTIEKNFPDLLKLPAYQKVTVYLSFVRRMISNPGAEISPDFYEEVKDSFYYVPVVQENIHVMGFYGWLKARMTQRNFYEVLMELVRKNEDE
ncbi:MAG: hypothetical protein SF052_06500 [Bacteroidia bacterium]|nr:hypothetical protein [Bacteroidia bacterium]